VARPHIVTLTTDFGLVDHFAGALRGVLLDVFPEVRIVDITHAIQAYDVLDGALAISESYKYFPGGSVHMVVVDPGVGSERRPILRPWASITLWLLTMACSPWCTRSGERAGS